MQISHNWHVRREQAGPGDIRSCSYQRQGCALCSNKVIGAPGWYQLLIVIAEVERDILPLRLPAFEETLILRLDPLLYPRASSLRELGIDCLIGDINQLSVLDGLLDGQVCEGNAS